MLGRLLILTSLVALAGCGSWAPQPGHGYVNHTAMAPANSMPESHNSMPRSFDVNAN